MLTLLLSVGCVTGVDVDIDADQDGLMSSEEETAGTDPANADSDGDGFADGVEVESFTDPLSASDAPYEGGWTINSCRNDITGEGYAEGNVLDGFTLQDQFEETVRIHDFCDQVLIVDFSAGWCGNCQAEAPQLQEFYAANKDKGFMAVTIYMENVDYSSPTMEEAQTWADTYGLEFPVLLDDGSVYNSFATATGESTIGLPLMVLVDRGLVVQMSSGATEEDAAALLEE